MNSNLFPPYQDPAEPNTRRDSISDPTAGPGRAPRLGLGFLWTMCAWCGADLDLQLVPQRNDGERSDGCCRPCFAKVMGYPFVPVVLLIPWPILALAGGVAW